jgi:phosphoheptose isomerase
MMETDFVFRKFVVYAKQLSSTLETLAPNDIVVFITKLQEQVEKGGAIFVAGNGGSLAISQHFVTDLVKLNKYQNRFRAIALGQNASLLSALSNDISFKNAFSIELSNSAEPGDLLVIISSSGRSENLITLAALGNELGCEVHSITGFNDSIMKEYSNFDINFHLDAGLYGPAEDCTLALLHFVIEELKTNMKFMHQERRERL